MVIRAVCPRCKSPRYKKNGHMHHGKHTHHGHDCGRQFVQCCAHSRIAAARRALIDRLLVERIALRGRCRAVGGTLTWLLGVLGQGFEALPAHLHVQPVTCPHHVLIQRLEVAAEAMASVVQKKANQQWMWSAMDAQNRQGIAFHVGDRSRRSARRRWAQRPQAYREQAPFYTEQSVVYAGVLPAAPPRALSQLARKTNHIERFNTTLRQRVSRVVREALSFSKKLAHHLGASKRFLCHYNLTRAAAA
jgi:insertion element IS1 protein InsB